jgi:hypothetical protein
MPGSNERETAAGRFFELDSLAANAGVSNRAAAPSAAAAFAAFERPKLLTSNSLSRVDIGGTA